MAAEVVIRNVRIIILELCFNSRELLLGVGRFAYKTSMFGKFLVCARR